MLAFCAGKNQIGLNAVGIALLPTFGAKNSADFGTLLFQLTVIFIIWFMFPFFTFARIIFSACWLQFVIFQ